MREYYFSTESVNVGYNGKPVVRNINIAVNKGEIVTLIGPNGAGKSTILKSIARQLELISGMAYLEREPLGQMKRERLAQKMAVVLTDKLTGEMMTCQDMVATGRYPYTGRFGILSEKDYEITEEAMELVHVTEIKDRDFARISDGQKQRVMLARAICQEPEVIILDEPTSYLDVKYKLEFLSVLQELRKKKGLTVIMSLHELELAEKISDKLLCVKGEYVDRFGTPEEILQPGYIRSLFHITTGSFDEENGNMELEAVLGNPEVFVIAGGGTGRSVYRRLQRRGIPFVTGILFENDLDYPVARALAAEVLAAEAFEPIGEGILEKAKKRMDCCKTVICSRKHFGTLESANQELLTYAQQTGKKISCMFG